MRRKRCSTVKNCAADGAETKNQNGAEKCTPVTARHHRNRIVSNATPARRSQELAKNQKLVDHSRLEIMFKVGRTARPRRASTHPRVRRRLSSQLKPRNSNVRGAFSFARSVVRAPQSSSIPGSELVSRTSLDGGTVPARRHPYISGGISYGKTA